MNSAWANETEKSNLKGNFSDCTVPDNQNANSKYLQFYGSLVSDSDSDSELAQLHPITRLNLGNVSCFFVSSQTKMAKLWVKSEMSHLDLQERGSRRQGLEGSVSHTQP
jgi:hypothetical protein